MYKVLIVDDEHYVVSLIEKIIDWKALDMTVAGTADNGESAIKMVQNIEPDILIVDVRMPGYDGITLMQKVREINNRIKFIVISGHRRFEYAKSAMKYNVEDYLLKPISKDELESILLKLKVKLQLEDDSLQTTKEVDNQLGISKQRMQLLLMERVLNAENLPSNIQKINQQYLTDFYYNNFCCAILKLDSSDKKLNKAFLSNLMQEISAGFTSVFKGDCSSCINIAGEYRTTFLLNYSTLSWLNEHLILASLKIGELIQKYQNIHHTLGIGEEILDLSLVNSSFIGAQNAINSRYEITNNSLILTSQLKCDTGVINIILSDIRRKNLISALQTFKPDKIKSCIDELFQLANEYGNSHSTICFELTKHIHIVFFEYISRIDVYKDSYETFYNQLLGELEPCASKHDVCNTLALHIFSFIDAYIAGGTNPAVRIAKQHIVENFSKNISLSSISNIVNLTPVYFSILFKREVGVNFVDYLSQYRIEMSKSLLKNVKNNINQVANECGFPDSRYFSKTFKKIVGITPTVYRSRHTE